MASPRRSSVERAESLDEIRDGLLALYAETSPSDLGSVMQRAFAAAELAGRFDVTEEA